MYKWFGTAQMVEMVKPDLIGAAELSFKELMEMFKHMEDTQGLYFHNNTDMSEIVNSFKTPQFLLELGRLSLFSDIVESDYEAQDGGEPLRQLASYIWSDAERENAWGVDHWGAPGRYVPEGRMGKRRDPDYFQQDIVNIIYSAGLFEERNDDPLNLSRRLKDLAIEVQGIPRGENNLQEIAQIIRDNADTLNMLAESWADDERYPDHTRTKALQFVRLTFGLASAPTIPVPFADMSRGFDKSGPTQGGWRFFYREGPDPTVIESNVKIPLHPPLAKVTYDTQYDANGQSGISVLKIKPYKIHGELYKGKEIPITLWGRNSYQPLGEEGNPHGGLITGFGCSVHQTEVASSLAAIIAAGASREEAEQHMERMMAVNPPHHEGPRMETAKFDLAQIWEAVHEGKPLSLRDYLNRPENAELHNKVFPNPPDLPDPGYAHLREYLDNNEQTLPLAASVTAGILAYGYPAQQGDVRLGWYDHAGQDVRLTPERPALWGNALVEAGTSRGIG